MVRAVILVVLLVCLIEVYGMPGKRVRRGFNNNGHGERGGGGGGGGGYYNHGSDERDASVSREDGGGCRGDNYENRESSYGSGRDDYNSNEKRHNGRPR